MIGYGLSLGREGKWGGGGDYLLSINYPLILFFKIIRGLSPLDFFKIDPLSDHQDLDQEGEGRRGKSFIC